MVTLRRALERRRRDDGVASLELLGMIPLVFVIAAIGLQVGVFLWAVTNTNEAVRQGARAESLGQHGCSAAEATLAPSLADHVVSCTSQGGNSSPFDQGYVRMSVRVPMLDLVERYLPDVTVTRTANLP